jgi:hypothetical protein
MLWIWIHIPFAQYSLCLDYYGSLADQCPIIHRRGASQLSPGTSGEWNRTQVTNRMFPKLKLIYVRVFL